MTTSGRGNRIRAGRQKYRPHPTRVIEPNMDITHYFDMGKYSAYIWSSYGLSALVLLGNLLVALRAHRTEYRRACQRLEHGRPSVS
jgi:heme exporter protein CcmD